jgi:hypothetical protein
MNNPQAPSLVLKTISVRSPGGIVELEIVCGKPIFVIGQNDPTPFLGPVLRRLFPVLYLLQTSLANCSFV